MSSKTLTQPLPAIDRQAPFADQVSGVVARIRTVLRGRAKSCALPLQTTSTFTRMVNGKPTKRVLEGARSPLELTPSAKDGSQPHTTFTREQVRSIAIQVVAIMSEKPSPADIRDRVPSYALGDKASNADLAKMLTLPYTPSKGNNAGRKLNAAGHAVAAYRREIGRLSKSNAITHAVKSGGAWYAEGVIGKDGEPVPYPSEKKARKAWCRARYNVYDGKVLVESWYETDKANRLAAAVVYQQGDALGNRAHSNLNRTVTGTLDDLSSAALRALAKKAGAPKRIYTGKGATARTRQWFSDDITRIGVLNE